MTSPNNQPQKAERMVRQARRDRVRDRFLAGMPKGGLCVEVGVWRGTFSQRILEIVSPERLVLIDPWRDLEEADSQSLTSRSGNAKMEMIYQDVVASFRKEIDEKRVIIMREKSKTALEKFADESINFAYVDGDHSYEGVCSDLESLFPKLAIGGVMAFDDYHLRGWWGDGVVRAIHEFLGRRASDVRILSVVGAQFALERLPRSKA